MSKYIDCVIGHAVGDAMGVPTEFLTREKLQKNPVTKMISRGQHDVPTGSWSDDTSMSVATMDSFIKKGEFDSIMDENLTDQLGLFDISDKPIERLNINKLKRIYDYGLFPDVFEAVIADVEKSQKVLQKIPKNRE